MKHHFKIAFLATAISAVGFTGSTNAGIMDWLFGDDGKTSTEKEKNTTPALADPTKGNVRVNMTMYTVDGQTISDYSFCDGMRSTYDMSCKIGFKMGEGVLPEKWGEKRKYIFFFLRKWPNADDMFRIEFRDNTSDLALISTTIKGASLKALNKGGVILPLLFRTNGADDAYLARFKQGDDIARVTFQILTDKRIGSPYDRMRR